MDEQVFLRDINYSYLIYGSPPDYYTGYVFDDIQVLVVMFFRRIVTVRFDMLGNALDVQYSDIGDLDEKAYLAAMGFKEGPITIKRFFLENEGIGIRDFPDVLAVILRSPKEFSQDEIAVARRELQRWSKDGIFQLCLGSDNDRWIEGNGIIESS